MISIKVKPCCLTRISQQPSATADDKLVVVGCAPCGRPDAVWAAPVSSSSPRSSLQRLVDRLARIPGEKCGLGFIVGTLYVDKTVQPTRCYLHGFAIGCEPDYTAATAAIGVKFNLTGIRRDITFIDQNRQVDIWR